MRICYIDEAGCTGALGANPASIQPVFLICGVVLRASQIGQLADEFIRIKEKNFPYLKASHPFRHSWVLSEIKGSYLRDNLRKGGRNRVRHSHVVLDSILGLFENYDARIFGRVWVKDPNTDLSKNIYTYSMQQIFETFNHFLDVNRDTGIVVADSRNKHLNVNVSHSIFTKKYLKRTDEYARVLELPMFAHSENHVGIQLADLLCSALLFPMAVHAYCGHVTQSIHYSDAYADLRARFGERLKERQYRYQDAGTMHGGIVVSDPVGQRSGGHMFHR